MKIWFAGNTGALKREEMVISFDVGRLYSYHYINMNSFSVKPLMIYCMKKKIDLFLDSGAFSAYTQKTEINIQEYIDFIKQHESVIQVYANLDKIHLTDKEISAATTWKNQMRMERAGLKPLPVFHYGEDIKWLKRYISKGYEYIALGGMVNAPNLIPWLDQLWNNYLTDSSGMPLAKVHAFGMTSLKLMMRYPWYSVDSTSWAVTGRLGSIYVPRFRNGQWVYDENSWKIAVSNKSPNLKEVGQHINTMPPTQRQIILEYIHAKGYVLGSSEFHMEPQTYELKDNEKWAQKKPNHKAEKRRVETIIEPGISNKYQLRDEMNIIYFLDLEKSMPAWPWSFESKTMKGFF